MFITSVEFHIKLFTHPSYVYDLHTAQISKLSPVELAQLDDMWLETMLNEKETVENGIIALIDMSG